MRDLDVGGLFPPIEEELGLYRHYFTGRVLNAGAGQRDISALVDGDLQNQDIKAGDHIDYQAPLHDIPVADGFFDSLICNAVLEHVENPDEVVAEFARVCRQGGILYLCVPFMQPEHLDPTDYQRYTLDGLERLVRLHGFEVIESGPVHSVYVTLGWIAREWLADRRRWTTPLIKLLVFPYLRRKVRRSDEQVHSLASAYRVIAKRV